MLVLVASTRSWGNDGGQTEAPVAWFGAFEASPGDAGVPDAGWLEPKLSVASGVGALSDGGLVQVGPGCFVPSAACLSKGQRAASMEAQLKEYELNPPGFRQLFVTGWVGFALGALTALVALAVGCWSFTGNLICR